MHNELSLGLFDLTTQHTHTHTEPSFFLWLSLRSGMVDVDFNGDTVSTHIGPTICLWGISIVLPIEQEAKARKHTHTSTSSNGAGSTW